MTILGISAFFHDAAAAIVEDGRVVAAAQEERFSRIKNDAAFPTGAVRFCLDFAGVDLQDLDAVVFYDKPLLKLERLLESYHAGVPRGLRSFVKSMPVWMKQKMMLKRVIRDELRKIQPFHGKILFCEHHLSHAASAFYPSPFEEAAILTIDGVGEWATTSIGVGRGKQIRFLQEMHFPHSLGLLYSAFTYYCGFTVNSGEYKLMGLAPYGDEGYLEFKHKIEQHLCTIYEDGSIFIHQEYFNYLSGLRMVNESRWKALFGFPPRAPEAALERCHCNLALAIQKVTEDIVHKLAATARRLTGLDNLCLAGGVALNCVANGKLPGTQHIFIQPAAGDAGGALGAALAAYHIHADGPVLPRRQSNPYLGPAYTADTIRKMNRKYRAVCSEHRDTVAVVAAALQAGKIVGWFQDRMEFGPRALGNRSILADARSPDMQRRLNLSIKHREGFRPFAPACTEERAEHYFGLCSPSPYMLLTRNLRKELCFELPPGYAGLPMAEKLAVTRSRFPAITHVDGSCRVQTVSPAGNKRFWDLLKAFEDLTGEALLINTSFNVRGEPVVCTPEEAYRCFMQTGMDMLVIGDFVYHKDEQPVFTSTTVIPIND
jgi:carbamoyltransferase